MVRKILYGLGIFSIGMLLSSCFPAKQKPCTGLKCKTYEKKIIGNLNTVLIKKERIVKKVNGGVLMCCDRVVSCEEDDPSVPVEECSNEKEICKPCSLRYIEETKGKILCMDKKCKKKMLIEKVIYESDITKKAYKKSELAILQSERRPMITYKTMKITFLPYVDENGILTMTHHKYVILKEPKWIVGDYLIVDKDGIKVKDVGYKDKNYEAISKEINNKSKDKNNIKNIMEDIKKKINKIKINKLDRNKIENEIYKAKVRVDIANVRGYPKFTSNIIRKKKKGSIVYIMKYNKKWYKLVGEDGFINSYLVDKIEKAPVSECKIVGILKENIDTGIGTIPQGSTVNIKERINDKLLIQYDNKNFLVPIESVGVYCDDVIKKKHIKTKKPATLKNKTTKETIETIEKTKKKKKETMPIVLKFYKECNKDLNNFKVFEYKNEIKETEIDKLTEISKKYKDLCPVGIKTNKGKVKILVLSNKKPSNEFIKADIKYKNLYQ